MPDERQLLGAEGERAAEKFLRRQRYTIVARNYRCPSGEVDLVALDRSTVVFVEVKTRTQAGFGSPLEAVDPRKQRQIQRAAQHYLKVALAAGRAPPLPLLPAPCRARSFRRPANPAGAPSPGSCCAGCWRPGSASAAPGCW